MTSAAPSASAALAAASPPPRLELAGLSCHFGAVRALDEIGLSVAPGEIVGLLGDSGCGKSTLLRVVAGLEAPCAGTLRLDGRAVDAGTPPETRGVGLMFQDYALFPHLTLAENVRFGLARMPRTEARAVARERLEQVGLLARADDYPGTLSGGESQRVALARALAPRPRVLLLDEPFSNLDRRTRDRVRADTLAALRATGTTALLVTHDPEEALAFCDRIALMRSGRIVQAGTGRDLYERPTSAFAARFLGEVAEWHGPCRAGCLDTPFGPLPAPGHAEGKPLLALFRAEHLRVAAAGCPARVASRSYGGAAARLTLRAEGFADAFVVGVADTDGSGPGDQIHLAWVGPFPIIFAESAD